MIACSFTLTPPPPPPPPAICVLQHFWGGGGGGGSKNYPPSPIDFQTYLRANPFLGLHNQSIHHILAILQVSEP